MTLFPLPQKIKNPSLGMNQTEWGIHRKPLLPESGAT
jgi:hypothetical protein